MSTEQLRSEFEKWANKLPSISISGFLDWQGDSYVDDYHQCLWQTWQASRSALAQQEKQPKLIGWRTTDYTDETTDPDLAKNWAAAVGVIPIFEGDINTKITPQPE